MTTDPREHVAPRVVLVLTQPDDETADIVMERMVEREVPVFRFDTADFPIRARLDLRMHQGRWTGTLKAFNGVLDISEVATVWYRRPTTFRLPRAMDASTQRFAAAEARHAFAGILYALVPRWVNAPHARAVAEYKPLQLQVAADHGLSVPETLLTNEGVAARTFAQHHHGAVVYKSLQGGVPVSQDGSRVLIPTTALEDENLADDEAISWTACQFQQRIDKRREVRVVIAGDRVLAAEAAPQTPNDDVIDWRLLDLDLRWQAHELPGTIAGALRDVVAALGLAAGVADLLIDDAGGYQFLEINPDGQWAWLEDEAGVPATEAFVDLLAASTPTPSGMAPSLAGLAASDSAKTSRAWSR